MTVHNQTSSGSSPATELNPNPVDWNPMIHFIAAKWPTVIRNNPVDNKTLIGLPHSYVVPTADDIGGFTFDEMFYWDSFFMSLGLLHYPHLRYLIVDMTKNLAFLFQKFGMIPNGSRFYFTSRSQPPFFTQMIKLAHQILVEEGDPSAADFLRQMTELAEQEHNNVWLGTGGGHLRLVYAGLSRYFDINVADALVVAESGWDQCPRCDFHRWRFHLPVCLNSILYKREIDLAEAWQTLGEEGRAHGWRESANVRKETINRLMWNSERSFFADYDYQRQRRNPMPSLAMFYPMWAGLATQQQAQCMVETWLPQFEQPGGLATTVKPKEGAQWAYPNGWAPLQMLVTDALDAYGFRNHAERIRIRWLNTCATTLAATGKMWEKLNVVECNHHADGGLYGQLPGFGWTWASCDYFWHKLKQAAVTEI